MSSFLDELKAELARLKEMVSPFETYKVNIYVSTLFADPLRDEEEETVLELDIQQKMSQDVCVRYFLAKLNHTILKDNQFDVCIREKPLVSLKDKFLNILQNMESQETRVENIGLLLYVASRLYMAQDGRRIYLITNLKSPLFALSSTWENYFLFRVNRKITDEVSTPKSGLKKTLGFIKAPLNLFSFGKPKLAEEKEATKDAKSKKEFHPAIFMEIAQHLAMLAVAPDEATLVLVELFRKYEIGSNLMQSVFIVHQKAISSQYEEKIKLTVAPKTRTPDPGSSLSRLSRVLLRVLPYLSVRETLQVTMVSRTVTRELTKSGYFAILRHHSLTPYQRRPPVQPRKGMNHPDCWNYG